MYNNPYMQPNFQNYGQQNINDRIDTQIAQLQQMKEQIKNNTHQPAINQTFQLAPNSQGMKYANSLEEVNKENVYVDTPFFSKDMTVLWLKNAKGDVKAYELREIIVKDQKDIQIEYLMSQINELKGMIKNESITNVDDTTTESVKNEKPSNVSTVSKSKTKSE